MIKILFEDKYFIIVNKPPNLLVHKSQESSDKDNLLKRLRNQLGFKVFPVHRLDRQVSGAIIFSKTGEYVTALQKMWHQDSFKKYYLTLSRGKFINNGEFNFPLNDKNKTPKDALTLFRPLISYTNASLLEVQIKTGRQHQIRRHFARNVDHILGDRMYGKKKYNDYFLHNYNLKRLFLHSFKLEFNHPYTQEIISITCPLSQDLQLCLALMRKEYLETLDKTDYIDCYEL